MQYQLTNEHKDFLAQNLANFIPTNVSTAINRLFEEYSAELDFDSFATTEPEVFEGKKLEMFAFLDLIFDAFTHGHIVPSKTPDKTDDVPSEPKVFEDEDGTQHIEEPQYSPLAPGMATWLSDNPMIQQRYVYTSKRMAELLNSRTLTV